MGSWTVKFEYQAGAAGLKGIHWLINYPKIDWTWPVNQPMPDKTILTKENCLSFIKEFGPIWAGNNYASIELIYLPDPDKNWALNYKSLLCDKWYCGQFGVKTWSDIKPKSTELSKAFIENLIYHHGEAWLAQKATWEIISLDVPDSDEVEPIKYSTLDELYKASLIAEQSEYEKSHASLYGIPETADEHVSNNWDGNSFATYGNVAKPMDNKNWTIDRWNKKGEHYWLEGFVWDNGEPIVNTLNWVQVKPEKTELTLEACEKFVIWANAPIHSWDDGLWKYVNLNNDQPKQIIPGEVVEVQIKTFSNTKITDDATFGYNVYVKYTFKATSVLKKRQILNSGDIEFKSRFLAKAAGMEAYEGWLQEQISKQQTQPEKPFESLTKTIPWTNHSNQTVEGPYGLMIPPHGQFIPKGTKYTPSNVVSYNNKGVVVSIPEAVIIKEGWNSEDIAVHPDEAAVVKQIEQKISQAMLQMSEEIVKDALLSGVAMQVPYDYSFSPKEEEEMDENK